MITIVDYGLGNVLAFANVYKRLNIEVQTASTAEELSKASKVILPGVGAFDHAMQRLDDSGMRAVLDELVLKRKLPVLGVCVGMQMMGNASDEGKLPGLGWVNGQVRAFKTSEIAGQLPLPHMGWNDVTPNASGGLFNQLEREARFYFLHSFYFECVAQQDVAAVSNYGISFHCALRAGNIYGVQFHPEKSHHFGAQLLKNFADL